MAGSGVVTPSQELTAASSRQARLRLARERRMQSQLPGSNILNTTHSHSSRGLGRAGHLSRLEAADSFCGGWVTHTMESVPTAGE